MALDKQQTLPPGTLLRETYSIREKIASGGMGEIYLADHARLRGKFAVKILNDRLAEDPKAIARFKREAEILALIRHPNVVQIFDFALTEAGIPFLAMEFVEGHDLAHHILQKGPLPLGRVVNIVHQIAAALEAAHARRVVHGDLKPANVMLVDSEGHPDLVKVLDFGVAHLFGASPGSREPTNLMLGTPSYMAPEQAECRNDEIDGRADQFALAVLTYVLLTGRDPFPGDSTVEVLSRVIHAEPTPLGERVSWPAQGVEAVLRRALSKRPEGRFGRILEFAYALSNAARSVVDTIAHPPAPVGSPSPLPVHLVRTEIGMIDGHKNRTARNTNSGRGLSRRPTGQTTVVARRPAELPKVA